MKLFSVYSALGLSIAVVTGLSLMSPAAEAETTSAQATKSLVVAELYTSQSCSSCPPAEALFSELAENEDLLTMEWHVDYWDKLVHGGSKWKDVYSKKSFTERQRSYNASLRGTRGVYTPQAVINGKLEEAGNRRQGVTQLLKSAPELSIPVQIKDGRVKVAASQANVEVLFVRLLKQHETNVKGGENKGRKLHGKNIVLDAQILGKTGQSSTEYKLPSVGQGETCAVLIQSIDESVGPVLGAAKC